MGAKIADVVLFNTRVQRHTKLVLWVSLPRHFLSRGKNFELLLPNRVAAKFFTSVFIESENFMSVFEQTLHPIANVDIKNILIGGKLIKLDGILAKVENL